MSGVVATTDLNELVVWLDIAGRPGVVMAHIPSSISNQCRYQRAITIIRTALFIR